MTATHVRYRQFLDGLAVAGGELVLDFDREGRLLGAHQRLAERSLPAAPAVDGGAALAAFRSRYPGLNVEQAELAAFLGAADVRRAWRVIATESPRERVAYFLDAETLELLQVMPLFFNAIPARVFEANPVTLLNDPSLRDNDDSANAVPLSAYTIAELPDLAATGGLIGPNITLADLEAPKTQPADTSQPLDFDRSNHGFEEVMAYYHLDRSQRHLQSLGYFGTRRIINRSLRVDAHAGGGADNSYYAVDVSGEGILYFGDGGVDDAEDPDILLHEYGHAIHEAIAPSAFLGPYSSEARALGEGFGDYWAFSGAYAASVASGRDPFCVGDWDARCGGGASTGCVYPAGADCLRRVDSVKTFDHYIFSEQRGTEHKNGEIWSSALREIFLALVQRDSIEIGRRHADQLVLESIFGMPPAPTFRTAGRRLLEADRLLSAGANTETICAALSARKIITASDCNALPRGDFTLFQSAEAPREIPDNDASGIVSAKFIDGARLIDQLQVRVDITHPFRGDLRISLSAPNGATVVLRSNSNDSADDLRTTFGLDSQSQESLDTFRGISARGVWKLQIADLGRADTGRLQSWALIFRFQEDSPILQRAITTSAGKHLAAVAHAAGAEGARFVSDVRIFNPGATNATVTMFFTPSATDGTSEFAAVKLSIDPKQIVALNDVVANDFRTTGVGNIDFRGDVSDLLITSRTYNVSEIGTYGQFIPAATTGEAIGQADTRLHIPQLRKTRQFRSNVGFTEVSGSAGIVELSLFDAADRLLESSTFSIAPFSHLQMPVLVTTEADIARAELRVVSGGARILGYGSVVDNGSGDAIYIPAEPSTPPGQARIIPAALHADGAHDTKWRTDLALTNLAQEQPVEIRYLPSTGTAAMTDTLTLASNASALLEDVLSSRFGILSGGGQLSVHAPGSLLVTSRTWTPGPDGTYGQFIGSRAASEAIALGGGPAETLQLESSAGFRTNLGVSELAGYEVAVRIRLFDAAGTEVFSTDRTVSPLGQLQFNASQAGAPEFANGRASFEVISGSGRILAYGSVIDNRSGDPIYIPAR